MSGETFTVALRQAAPIPLDVEFSCGAGEMLAIVGPSGSGKTTVLRSIAGLHPAAGAISCQGQTWLDSNRGINLGVQQRRVGMMFQHYALFPHLTALQNIVIALPDGNRERQVSDANRLMALVHMAGLEKRYPSQLSGGQQQRIALARALARDPRVLLLDEPFAAVDQQTRRKLMRELARLRLQFRMPVILVTHDLDEARMLADRISVLNQGRTLQTDAPGTLFERPANAEVARMIGLDNVLEGTVLRHDPAAGISHLQWHAHVLRARLNDAIAPGTAVDWAVAAHHLGLQRRERATPDLPENPVHGQIEEFVPLGDFAAVTVRLDDGSDRLYLSLPAHAGGRDGFERGAEVTVSMPAAAIHLMPREPG